MTLCLWSKDDNFQCPGKNKKLKISDNNPRYNIESWASLNKRNYPQICSLHQPSQYNEGLLRPVPRVHSCSGTRSIRHNTSPLWRHNVAKRVIRNPSRWACFHARTNWQHNIQKTELFTNVWSWSLPHRPLRSLLWKCSIWKWEVATNGHKNFIFWEQDIIWRKPSKFVN